MTRCPITRGAGNSLGCCRVAGHPTANGPAEHAGCCMHWSAFLHGIAAPHVYVMGVSSPLGCGKGTQLDAAD